MPTKKPRIHVTIDQKTAELLEYLAKQEKKSVSALTTELILDALEKREDLELSMLAASRDNNKAKIVSHEDVWK